MRILLCYFDSKVKRIFTERQDENGKTVRALSSTHNFVHKNEIVAKIVSIESPDEIKNHIDEGYNFHTVEKNTALKAGEGVIFDPEKGQFLANNYGFAIIEDSTQRIKLLTPLQISKNKVQAYYLVFPTKLGQIPSYKDIEDVLYAKKILAIADKESIEAQLREINTSEKTLHRVLVSKGREAINGYDEYFVPMMKLEKKAGKFLEDGRIDFKEQDSIIEIKRGQEILKKIPGVKAEEGMTILDAAKSVGINIPTLCHMKDLFPTGACRLCSVEVEGMRGLIPSCAYPVSDGLIVETNSQRVRSARKTIIELLVENHPQDCLVCVRNMNCELQNFAEQYGLREHRYKGETKDHAIDISSPSMERDPAKCILCGRCVRTCNEIQKVGAIDFTNRGFRSNVTTPFNKGLNISDCILCGQCILVCPTAALREKSHLKDVSAALNNKKKFTVVQIAPAVRASFGEEYNLPIGTNVTGQLVTALRRVGFKKVFDTNFGADLTIMEESTELINRIENGKKLPMFTSCCPGWVKYVEQNDPEILDHVSTCKSPHEMEGAVIKSYYAKKMGLNPEDIFVVSIMPCTVKKFEAVRPELQLNNLADVDAVLTTRELVRLFKMAGIDFNDLPEGEFDNPLGDSTGAAAIFGTSGGVMEAALRTAYFTLTKKELEHLEFEELRGNDGIKEAEVEINGAIIKVAAVNGIGNIGKVLDDVKNGTSKYHFIEVMACPGGCINGGGQPIHQKPEKVMKRVKALYEIDSKMTNRRSHENKGVQQLYIEFFGQPNSHKSHEILHTTYVNRKEILKGKLS